MATADSRTVEEMRTSLANRPSFFGGTVSTRLLSAAPGWQPPAPPTKEAPKGHMRSAARAGSHQPGTQQTRQRMARDFSSLDDDDAAAPATPHRMPKLGERALAAIAAVEKLKAQAGRDSTPPLPRPQAGYGQDVLPKSAAANEHARKAKVVLPKGKRGAAARLLAVAPQGQGGLTGRQAADKLMQEKLAELRSRRATLPAANGTGSGVPATAAEAAKQGRSWASSSAPGKRRAETEVDSLEEDSADEAGLGGDWRAAMRSITGYDPARYGPEGDDRSMVASRAQIEAEERRSLRLGRSEDERDAAAEARARAAKAAKKERAHKRRKAGGADAFLA